MTSPLRDLLRLAGLLALVVLGGGLAGLALVHLTARALTFQ